MNDISVFLTLDDIYFSAAPNNTPSLDRLDVPVTSDVGAHQADTTGGQTANPSAEDGGGPRSSSGVSQRGGRDLPRSTVYLSMRRQAATDEIATVIGRALKREKDGVLESPPECTTVIFLDDVHCAQEVWIPPSSSLADGVRALFHEGRWNRSVCWDPVHGQREAIQLDACSCSMLDSTCEWRVYAQHFR